MQSLAWTTFPRGFRAIDTCFSDLRLSFGDLSEDTLSTYCVRGACCRYSEIGGANRDRTGDLYNAIVTGYDFWALPRISGLVLNTRSSYISSCR